MDVKVVSLVLALLLLSVVNAQEDQDAFVSTSEDVSMLPGATTRLVCIGSRSDLSYYIKNRIKWSVLFSNGTERLLTEGFYADTTSRDLFEGDAPKYGITYKTSANGFAFNLDVNDLQHSDNGEYTCSLLKDGQTVLDKNTTILTILNPIQKLTLEIHTMDHMNKYKSVYSIMDSTTTNMPTTTTVTMETNETMNTVNITNTENSESASTNLGPGQYMMLCVAEGSNPSPVVSVFHNGNQLGVSVDEPGLRSLNQGQVSYMSKVSMMDITFKSMATEQLISCEANVPGTSFAVASALFPFMVELEKPDFVCSNLSSRQGDRYQEFVCTLTATEGSDHITCDKVSWKFGDTGHVMNSTDKYSDIAGDFDIMETQCEKTQDGLSTSLKFYLVNAVHFQTLFYVNYDMGDGSIQHPVQLGETSASYMVVPNALITLIAFFVSWNL